MKKSKVKVKTRYLDLFVDYAFKRMFGTEPSKPYLIDLLNAILQLEDEIVDIQYLDREQLGLTIDDRKAVFDVLCIDQMGRRFLIELQHLEQENFCDRSLYYSTFPIQVQAMKGEWDYKLRETITIGVLGFKLENTDPDEFVHHIRLMNEKSGQVFNPNLSYVYIEAPKFRKGEKELKSRLDQWLYVLTGMATFKEIPLTLQEDELFKSFFMAAEVANLKLAEYMEYVANQKEVWDRYAEKKYARKEGLEAGLEKGLQKGLEKGREEEKHSIARAMKAKGLDISLISETTGLSVKEINKL